MTFPATMCLEGSLVVPTVVYGYLSLPYSYSAFDQCNIKEYTVTSWKELPRVMYDKLAHAHFVAHKTPIMPQNTKVRRLSLGKVCAFFGQMFADACYISDADDLFLYLTEQRCERSRNMLRGNRLYYLRFLLFVFSLFCLTFVSLYCAFSFL